MDDLIVWENKLIDSFLNACLKLLTPKLNQELELRIRRKTGSVSSNHSCCHNNKNLNYSFKKNSNDLVGSFLDNIIKSNVFSKLLIGIAERGSKIYYRIISKYTNKQNCLKKSEEICIRNEILKESIIREIECKVLRMIQQQHQDQSRYISQMAIPDKNTSIQNIFESSIMNNLMNNGFAIIKNFLGKNYCDEIFRELELLEYGGFFNEFHECNIRTDKVYWAGLSDIDRYNQSSLYKLIEKMNNIPYELNSKAKLGLQVSNIYQLSYYHADGAFYKVHMDNCLDNYHDNGRKLTCIYYPNNIIRQFHEGGCLILYSRQSLEAQKSKSTLNPSDFSKNIVFELVPSGDTLVVFSSREIPHEVTANYSKRFSITLWITGPPGSCDGF